VNPQAFSMLQQGMNFGVHIVTNPGTVIQNHARSPAKDKDNNYNKRDTVTLFVTGTKLLVLYVRPRKEKFSQNHFLAAFITELSQENSNSKRRVDKKELILHMDNAMCYNGREIRECFARKKMMRILHPVNSPDLSPCDFRFFGYTKNN
jgi:hypothetical protein